MGLRAGLRLRCLVGVWELRSHGVPTRSGLQGAGTAVPFSGNFGNGRGDAVWLWRTAALGAVSAFASRRRSVSLAAKAAGAARLSSLLARGRRSRHPPTLHMVLEALQAQDGKKGASVVAIKRFILAKYPTVDPVRLKYLLKRALATGLSRGFLVRPHNSAALGATGRFKVSGAARAGLGLGAADAGCSHVLLLPCSQLAPKRLQQKQAQGQEDPGEGPAPKTGRRGAAEAARAPAVARSDGGQGNGRGLGRTPVRCSACAHLLLLFCRHGQGGAESSEEEAEGKACRCEYGWARRPGDASTAPKLWVVAWQQPEALCSLQAQPAVEKPRSHGVKAHQAPGKGRPQPPAAPAASGVREDSADRPAGVKRPKKAPAAKSKGKVPEEAQEAASKKGGKAKARKPQAALGAGQGGKAGAQEAAPGRKVS